MAPSTDHPFSGPALAMLDVEQIPAGFRVLDGLVKEAPVHVLRAGTTQPGHFLVLFEGQVEPVQFSMDRAVSLAGSHLVDQVLLADAEPRIRASIDAGKFVRPAKHGDTALILVTESPPSLLADLDVALKGAVVELLGLRMADGLGGRGLAVLWGETHDVQAAQELVERTHERRSVPPATMTMIPRADDDMLAAIVAGTHFFGAWRG